MKLPSLVISISATLSLLLVGCGGGGGSSTPSLTLPYTGSTQRATVDSDNSDDLAAGVVEATSTIEDYGNSPTLKSAADKLSVSNVVDDVKTSFINQLTMHFDDSLVARVEESYDCFYEGTESFIFPDLDPNATSIPSSGRGSVIFDNCRDDFDTTLDGSFDFIWSGYSDSAGFQNFTIVYNITVTITGEPAIVVNGSVICTDYGDNCTVSEYLVGDDGTQYSVENVVTSGNAVSGYNLSARVYHESFGYVDIEATGITYCANGNIQSGNISVTDSTGVVVLEVSITNCDEYTVTFNGVSEVYFQ